MPKDYPEIAAELGKRIEGEVRFDKYSRLLYSTDASMYEIEPIGVVIPRQRGDVQAAIEVANKFNVPVLPRGGGTALAGQTVGHAIVLDFSKYMNRVLEVNQEELWCRVEPGLVQDELNAHVRPQGLLFGPDTSTSNRATIGGMVGNNSAGAHSLTYGKTLDHVIELTVCLSDGSEVVLKIFQRKSWLRSPPATAWKAALVARSRRWRKSITMKFSRAIRKFCAACPATT
jgi:FAD/FMN-containing dehydrogenase